MSGLEGAQAAVQAAEAAFSQGDLDGVIGNLSVAIRGFTAADRPCEAALACAQLGDAMMIAGQFTVGRAWLARAERLVADLDPCLEQGWVAVAPMGCDVDDPAELLQKADLALDRARRFGDLDLETKALADGGLARVQAGRITEGMAQLDEAMALACGPAERTEVVGKSVCSLFTACYFAADYERFDSWSVALRARGVIGPAPGTAAFLTSHCDSVRASLLMELGRWGEADEVLVDAVDAFEATMHAPAWHPAITLADLRIRQGRHRDAEALLLGKDQMMQALLPAARLHLARGDHELALVAARRGLRAMGDDRLRAIELLVVAVEVHLASGDLDAAEAELVELEARVDGLAVDAISARVDVVAARLLAARTQWAQAAALLEARLERLDRTVLPWLRAAVLVELARVHEAAGDDPAARRIAAEAERALAAIDVVLPAVDADLLARLGSSAVPVPDAATVAVLRRDGRWWSASAGGSTVRLPATKGLQYLAALVEVPGCERHALDLVDRFEGVGDVDRRALGDAGALVDGAARTAYRRRIEELRGDIDAALEAGHSERAASLQGEMDELVAHLAAAFGLGGRERVAGLATEKARLNVTRALRTALKKIEAALPEAGAALDRRIRTGIYCAYQPEPGDRIGWIVQS